MATQTFIQIRFTEETKYGSYNDALYFTEDEYASLKAEDIEEEKQKRINNYISIIGNPTVAPEPTKEDLQAQKEQVLAQSAELNARIVEIEAKIVEIDSKVEEPIKEEPVKGELIEVDVIINK